MSKFLPKHGISPHIAVIEPDVTDVMVKLVGAEVDTA